MPPTEVTFRLSPSYGLTTGYEANEWFIDMMYEYEEFDVETDKPEEWPVPFWSETVRPVVEESPSVCSHPDSAIESTGNTTPAALPPPGARTRGSFIMARVLVVDDEQSDRLILEKILEQGDHEVYFASDGEEAFKSYLKNRIEIIITDLNMPHVDGLEFIEAVLALFPEAVIIAVSGKGPDELDAAQNAGARVALSKPIDPWELLKAILEVGPDSVTPS